MHNKIKYSANAIDSHYALCLWIKQFKLFGDFSVLNKKLKEDYFDIIITMTDKISFTSGSLGSIPFLERILQDALSRVDVHALLHYGDAKGEQLLREHIIKLHFSHLTAVSPLKELQFC